MYRALKLRRKSKLTELQTSDGSVTKTTIGINSA